MPKSRESPKRDSVPPKQGKKRSNPRDELHPASICNAIRHHSFSILEKTGDMEKALRALSDYSLPPRLQRTFRAGLKAELIFFLENQTALQLEPLLDAGVKADFSGFRVGKPVSIDVPANV